MSIDKPFGLVQQRVGETTPDARLPGDPSNALALLGEAPLPLGEDRAASPLRVSTHSSMYSTIFPKRYLLTAVAVFTYMLVALPAYAEKPEHLKQLLDTNKCRKCDLSKAKLSRKNLVRADLNDANLSRADLSSADLSNADLREADLSSAKLSRANLSRAELTNANLNSADLNGASLNSADLRNANLSSTDLSQADLSGVNLSGVNLIPILYEAALNKASRIKS